MADMLHSWKIQVCFYIPSQTDSDVQGGHGEGWVQLLSLIAVQLEAPG